jgi:putative effector of murein hydrolase LrgA (UPF0299 family)
MESLRTLWNLFQFLSVLIVPQLLGVLAYFRVRRFHLLAHLVGFLIPPLLFFYLAGVIVISSATREAQARGEEVCGTFTGMMMLAILFGAGLQAAFSLGVQLTLHARHRASMATK